MWTLVSLLLPQSLNINTTNTTKQNKTNEQTNAHTNTNNSPNEHNTPYLGWESCDHEHHGVGYALDTPVDLEFDRQSAEEKRNAN
jgi:hypothetical protein